MSKTSKKMTVQPMSKALVSDYESKVIKAYENGEPTIKGMRLEMAFNLSRLYRGKAHKTAGYDSFTDYLTAVFPFKEVTTAQMATWARTADKFLSRKADGTLVNQIGDGWELSSLERLNSVPVETIKKAISDGKLSPDMPQNDVKAWVSSLPKEGRVKILTQWKSRANGAISVEEDIKSPGDNKHTHVWKDGDILYLFYVDSTGATGGEVWDKVKPEPKNHTVGKSKEEVAADALRALDPDTLKALVAKILG